MADIFVCSSCGKHYEEGFSFCPECGGTVMKEENTNGATAEAPFSGNIPPVPPAPSQEQFGGSVPPEAPTSGAFTSSSAPENRGGYTPPMNSGNPQGGYVPPMNNGYMPPHQYQQQPEKKPSEVKGILAIVGMIVGIVSIVLSCLNFIDIPIAIAGLVLSIIGVGSSKKGCAIAGIVCSAVGLVLSVIILILGLAGIGMMEKNRVDFDSYYYENYEDYNDMYNDIYDDLYDSIY